MVKINILGSCVTRDAFQNPNNYNLLNYFARTSIISIMSSPYSIKLDNILLDSNFQKNTVYQDANKEILPKLMNQPSEYLIIDFIDERFNIIQASESYLTLSNELRGSGVLNNLIYKKFERDNEGLLELWSKSADEFFKEILKVYDPSKVILHQTYWRERYLDKNNQQNTFSDIVMREIKRQNQLLKYYYDYCISSVPSVNVVNMTDEYFLACENHIWGLAPYHFEKSYYDVFLKKLDEIIFNEKSNQNMEQFIAENKKAQPEKIMFFEERKEKFKSCTKCSISDGILEIFVEQNEDNLQYAFYIKNNRNIIYKGWYLEIPTFNYSLKNIDIEQIEVVVFVRNQEGSIFHYTIEVN